MSRRMLESGSGFTEMMCDTAAQPGMPEAEQQMVPAKRKRGESQYILMSSQTAVIAATQAISTAAAEHVGKSFAKMSPHFLSTTSGRSRNLRGNITVHFVPSHRYP